jgi:hypothetical protein
MGEWMYTSTFSFPRHLLVVSDHLHAPAALPIGEIANFIGASVGPRTSVDDVEKREFLTLPGLEL